MIGFFLALPTTAWQKYQDKGPHFVSLANQTLGFVTDDFRSDGSAGGEHERECLQWLTDDHWSCSLQYNHFTLDLQVSAAECSEGQAKSTVKTLSN